MSETVNPFDCAIELANDNIEQSKQQILMKKAEIRLLEVMKATYESLKYDYKEQTKPSCLITNMLPHSIKKGQ